MTAVIGWDIGGVNTKMARIVNGIVAAVRSRPYELQREPRALAPLLRELHADGGGTASDVHAVTMTAELSQMFRTKREGVSFVLDAVDEAFPSSRVQVFTVDGRFVDPVTARREPLAVGAANWAATARQVARSHPDALLIDIGTTTTDIIPIVDGLVVADGSTDPSRLASSELVYTGALRTPVEAIASRLPFGGGLAAVAAEGFALAGDVHVWRGHLAPEDYTCPTPDGRPATREFAGERLARVVCADREMLDEAAISAMADTLARAQTQRVVAAMSRVLARHPSLRRAVVTGLGSFIAAAAARDAGLDVVMLADSLGDDAARCAPAASVALLFEALELDPRRLKPALYGDSRRAGASTAASPDSRRAGATAFAKVTADRRSSPAREGWSAPASEALAAASPRQRIVETVVKIGGGLLSAPDALHPTLEIVADAARTTRLLVVPGGGPFADGVREVDRRIGLSDDAAHWMAILAMDQYAHLIASRLPGAVLITRMSEIRPVIDSARVPVLAPSRWLRQVDPLPHSWDVTSDSIAAWAAGETGAQSLVLIKPRGAVGVGFVDPYFVQATPDGVKVSIQAADNLDSLRAALIRPERDTGFDAHRTARR
ncbi:MAG TPA: hydantoinase/oxoprolinase family protein [Vicinamibacterales bacterium]|jgi:hypothetical protein